MRAKNMKQLKSMINKKLRDELNKQGSSTADIIKVTESIATEKEVYSVYQPESYGRRGDAGGLADVTNMEHEAQIIKGKVVLNVVNTTPPSNPDSPLKESELAALVELGHGGGGLRYEYVKEGAEYLKPRPFQQEAVNELDRTKLHISALSHDLKSAGFKIRFK